MNEPFADDKYWKAAEKEIITLEEKGAWDVVECENDMSLVEPGLSSTSDFLMIL